ncbi:extracellular solute-binding protein [Mameliella alba]|uniref:ABC transporter substrate-binding protein n=1 Tax=Mameliella alba TaxID=561184 RepID=UPI001C9826A2|nr:extracellular solute-binding protein [Mameliella alba]MBY6120389.1 extracellular solute-binding protein [Mameliella alba]
MKNDTTHFTPRHIQTRRRMLKSMGALGILPAASSLLPTAAFAQNMTQESIATASGPLNFLGSQPYQVESTWPKDLDITWAYNSTNEDILVKTQQKGAFDAIIIYQGMIDQLLKLNRIEPIDTSLLSNWDEMSPSFQDANVIRRNGDVYAVPLHWGYGYLEYNADHVDAPKSYEDLLSPKLTKKIGIPDDPYAVITTFAIFSGAEKPNNLTPKEFDEALKLLHSFKPQILTIHNYGDEISLFARGDIWVGFPEYSNSLAKSREAGATNLQKTELAAWSYIDCMMVLKDAPNREAAYKFINNALSAGAQLASTEHSMAFPVNDAAIPAIAEEMRYESAEQALELAPMMPGVTVETGGPDVPFQEWMQAWIEFKAA